MTTPARARARIHLAAELAGWDLRPQGLTDVYRRGTRRVIVTYDLHDRVVAGWRKSDTEAARMIYARWEATEEDRIVRLFTLRRWTDTD